MAEELNYIKNCTEKLKEGSGETRLTESKAAGDDRETRSCRSGGACVWYHSNSFHLLILAFLKRPSTVLTSDVTYAQQIKAM